MSRMILLSGRANSLRRHLALLLLLILLPATACLGTEIKFIPSVEVRDVYNDNLFYESTDKISDLYTVCSPGVRLTDRTERLDALLQSRLDWYKYRDNTDLDATDHDHQGRLRYRITDRWDVATEARYTRDSQIDRDIESTGLVLGTAKREHKRYALQTTYALTEKTTTQASYAYDAENFNQSEYVDSQVQAAGLGFTYNLDSLLALTFARLNLNYNAYDFTETTAQSYSALAGISRRLTEAVSIALDAGQNYTRTTFEPEDFPEYQEKQSNQGTIGQASLTYTGETFDASLTAYHDVRSVSGISGTAMRSSVRLDLNRRITYKLRGGLSLEYFRNKADQGQQASSDIDEETWRIQPSLRYDITNDLACEGSYRYRRWDDHVAELDTGQNMVYLRFIWQYPIPH